jgi:hypothetical protein
MTEAAAREDLKNYRELFPVPLALAVTCLLGQILIAADRTVRRRGPVAIANAPANQS